MSESCMLIHAHGMHCHGCERIIEHAVQKIPGVSQVKADYPSETLEARFDPAATGPDDIRAAVEQAGYRVFAIDQPRRRLGPLARLASAAAALAGLALIIHLDANWISENGEPDVTRRLSLGLIFLLGLLTGFHCVGMCGAFVLSYVADDAEAERHSFASHFLYGAGKTLSYTLIGAAFGELGAIVAFTPMLRGAVGLLAGAFLVVYGLNTLGYLTPLRRFRLGLPAPLHAFLDELAGRRHRPFVIGLLNGLMIACGPLQAMYISAAGTGSAIEGAKMLFAFGLGTLPMLTAFGALTTVISGALAHRLLKLSGAVIVALGAVMMNRGLILMGSGYDLGSVLGAIQRAREPAPGLSAQPLLSPEFRVQASLEAEDASRAQPSSQTIEMDVTASGYSPNRFVLAKGVPVKWVITGKKITTCNRRVVVPALGLEFEVKQDRQTIEFTPTETGVIPWSCWMGMLRGEFDVVDEPPSPAVRPGTAGARPALARPPPIAASNASPILKPNLNYVVAPRDTLTRIAVKVYCDAKRARDIAAVNPGVAPRRLRPGQRLSLPAARSPCDPDPGPFERLDGAEGRQPGSRRDPQRR